MSLAFALAGTPVLLLGCSQGEGDRCEINSDCASGLFCSPTGSPHNGVCKPSVTGGSPSQDAAAPVATPDAASDVPNIAADASADAPVTVGGDASPDADAADDSSVAD
jgi:hypothetical protein